MTQAITRSLRGPGPGTVWSRLVLWGAGVSLSLLVAWAFEIGASATANQNARLRFDSVARSAQYSLTARIKSYTDVVRGMVAMFQTKETPVTRLEFHRYVEALEIPRFFPAIEGVTWAEYVPHEKREAYIARVRADHSMVAGGYPDFTITPPGVRPSYTVMTYLEPADRLKDKFGADIGAAPQNARALELARDTGKMSATGRPIIVAKPKPHIGLGMRLPVYHTGASLANAAETARRLRRFGRHRLQCRRWPGYPRRAGGARREDGAVIPECADPEHAQLSGDRQLRDGAAGRLQRQPVEGPVPRMRKADLYTASTGCLPPMAAADRLGRQHADVRLLLHAVLVAPRAIEQRVLLDTVLDNVDAHVYMKDRERRYRYVNAKHRRGDGLPAEEIIGKLDRDVMPAGAGRRLLGTGPPCSARARPASTSSPSRWQRAPAVDRQGAGAARRRGARR
jgi:two-component system sensor histidine kinase/response regulator